jgi:hypothetical protein
LLVSAAQNATEKKHMRAEGMRQFPSPRRDHQLAFWRRRSKADSRGNSSKIRCRATL